MKTNVYDNNGDDNFHDLSIVRIRVKQPVTVTLGREGGLHLRKAPVTYALRTYTYWGRAYALKSSLEVRPTAVGSLKMAGPRWARSGPM